MIIMGFLGGLMGYVPLKKTSASARKGQYLLVHTEIFKISDFFEISLIL
jgi:hypothetical protein